MNETTILIIDDEVQIRRLLTITLEMKGYKVIKYMSLQTLAKEWLRLPCIHLH